WRTVYDGVARANKAILGANAATDMSVAEKTAAVAEARFLRGHFHFEAKKMWNNVPYIDETVTDFKVANTVDIWPAIEADFKFAMDNLPVVQKYKGQGNKWAAACYLAKAYMFEKKFAEAKALLATIIPAAYGGSGNGANAQGQPYALMPNFDDNSNPEMENGPEHVFQIQFSVNDGSGGANSNIGEMGNYSAYYGLTTLYTTWKQPSFNLVNAFKTDANGLPLLDTYNDVNMTNDEEVGQYDYYNTYQDNVDPRLDWTVGRRGVPYLDWTGSSYPPPTYTTSNPGSDPTAGWVANRTFGGPYINIKGMYRNNVDPNTYLANHNYNEDNGQYYLFTSGVNISIIRFADVLLWAAECEVEMGGLEKAREYVNYIRKRAKTGRQVEVVYDNNGGYAASAVYNIDTYNTPWADQGMARKAVRFERRIELALEGQRFFDLVRWGIAADYINAYLLKEKDRLPANLTGVTFTANKNEYFPIPQIEIDLNANLKQNPGY
ncbi:MAG: RagB/SusD family nutrient uptake outer membrane protein, partial [Mucilaginibacter sp.]